MAAFGVVLSSLLLAGPAVAAPPGDAGILSTGRSDVCNTYVCGSGTFTWGTTKLTGAMSVKDNECDKHGVGIYIDVLHSDGSWKRGAIHYNDNGCHAGYSVFKGLTWTDSKRIAGFRVVGLRSNNTHTNYYNGTFVDNPLT